MTWLDTPCTAFEGGRCIASGPLRQVAMATKPVVDRWASSIAPPPILVFDDATSEVIELDWRGSEADFATRLAATDLALRPTEQQAPPPAGAPEDSPVPRGRGRPKLGVAAREVTLLPRHWEWLAAQPGGASVALRKLVEVARKASEDKDQVRKAQAVGYKFMSTMAGHEVGFEEASRALFAGNQQGFEAQIATWPKDVQLHLQKILRAAFAV
jgi:uncharacterized protein